ncbi:hypothetical protein [Sabulibacter ruber]|uniref:hypothetical protein n=1 Tax=Sabulibacter ruber TaxID=2811901 RepID=UPI001A95C5F4|nr:hypothetical protein [Sabulibacter ruber]
MFILITVGCKENSESNYNNDLEVISNVITSDKRLKRILDEYIKEIDCGNYTHKIFFDRVRYNQTIITLRSLSYDTAYILKHKPLLQIKYKDIPFLIFNGMEEYFNGQYDFGEKGKNNIDWFNESHKPMQWTVVDSAGVVKINKEGSLPYVAIPGVGYCD